VIESIPVFYVVHNCKQVLTATIAAFIGFERGWKNKQSYLMAIYVDESG
jgi:hypothetical protein